ncbi:MAG TPA: DNA repair protein RecO [Pseudomonadales bacterium]
MTRVLDEPAVVLHARPYRESSAILSLLTQHHGRVALVARGLRGGRRGNVLQPFNRVRVGWSGRGNLATLTGCELTRHAWLTGNALAAAFYVIELITRLLPEREAVPELYAAVCWALERLEQPDAPVDVTLRIFERRLLEELGYGIDFDREAETGEPIVDEASYAFRPDAGFLRSPPGERAHPGAVLRAIAAEDYSSRAARVAARRIFRTALRPLLGERPLASRRLLSRERR